MARAIAIRDGAERIMKWFGSCTDIDDQKRVEEDLRRANQDLEQFAFSASHDLQEPLRSVKVYSELLVKRYGDVLDGEALEFVQYVRSGATRMETLVRDLLTYTQLMKFQMPSTVVDGNEALQAAIANLAEAVKQSGALIHAGPLPSVRIHGAHLQQLFQNLVGNAIKYRSPERTPAVHVAADRENGHWLFTVSDNGIGIAPEYQESIFVGTVTLRYRRRRIGPEVC
jgi:light-regulated signal transduction histidine kinase (bacteriophytochrome)